MLKNVNHTLHMSSITQQNNDIAVGNRRAVIFLFAKQFFDFFCHQTGFRFGSAEAFRQGFFFLGSALFHRFFSLRYQQFRFAQGGVILIFFLINHLFFGLVIPDACGNGTEENVKDFIDGSDDSFVTAKVFGHKNRRGFVPGVGIAKRKRLFHRGKDRRIRRTEAVDALLDIADHKTVVVLGERLENLVLNGADILVFVDENHAVLTSHHVGSRGAFSVFPKALVEIALKVVVLTNTETFFLGTERRIKSGKHRERRFGGVARLVV